MNNRLKRVERKVPPKEPELIRVIWREVGQPEPQELIDARQRGERVITWQDIEGVPDEQAHEEG